MGSTGVRGEGRREGKGLARQATDQVYRVSGAGEESNVNAAQPRRSGRWVCRRYYLVSFLIKALQWSF